MSPIPARPPSATAPAARPPVFNFVRQDKLERNDAWNRGRNDGMVGDIVIPDTDPTSLLTPAEVVATALQYHQFTVVPSDVANGLDLTSLTFDVRGSVSTFRATLYLQSSVGGLESGGAIIPESGGNYQVVSDVNDGLSYDLSGAAFQGLDTVTFRLVWGNDNAG